MQQSFTIERLLVYWFFLLAGIVQTVPAFSQGYVDDGKRYAMYTVYHHGDVDGSMQDRQIRGMKDAFANGCNSVVIGISWGTLQPSLNSAPNWAYIDRFIQVAQQYNAKIALRLRTLRKDRVGFWPEEQSMKDTQGNIMQLEGETHPRFGYTPAIDKAQDFIRAATQRYKYLNDRGELLFMSITFNPQWENEYWFTSFPSETRTSFDFNELTIGDFQRWSLAKYGSMNALNSNWGTNYRAVTDIRPTYPNNELRGGYQGKRGADWYTFRHLQLKSFGDRFAQTVKAVDPTIRVVTEQGSVYDIISANRGTLAFKNMAELYDGIKVNDGLEYIHQFSTDLLRSNVKPGGWVLNELDGSTFLSDRLDRSAEQAVMAENLFKYGAKIITFANFFIDANHDYLRAILDKIKAKGLLNQPVPTVTPVATMTYKLSTLVQSNVYESNILGQWNTLRGGNDGKPVRILIDEDLLTGVTTPPLNQPPTVANQVPDQTTVVNRSFSYKIPDNTFADADGQITGVTLSGLPTGLTYDAATRTISGTPVSIGSNEITVRAADNSNATVTDSFTLTVRRSTLPLQLLDPTVDCVTGRFEFRSTEGDGSAVEYAIDNLYSWNTQTLYTLAESLRSGSSLTIRARQSGIELVLNYRTTCPTSTSGSNKPPVVNSQLLDQSTVTGRPFLITLPANVFTDPDGQIVSVSLSGLPAGITYNSSTRIIEGTPANAGVWTVTATATDDKGATTSTTFRFTVEGTSTGRPLRLLDPVMNCTTGLFEFRSADGDGTPIEYSIDRVMNWSTQTSFTMPLSARYNEQFDIKARQSGQVYASVYYAGCKASNQFPTVRAPIANQSLIQLQSMSLVIPATTFADADGTIGSVSLTGLPPGLTYAANTLTLSGAPTAAGSWTVTATAMDNQGASVSTTFVITVILQVKALRLLDPLVDCSTGRFEFRSADGDGTPVEYAADDFYSYNVRTVYTLAEQFRTGTRITLRARQSGISYIAYYSTACAGVNRLPVVNAPIANQSGTVSKTVSILIPAGTFTDSDGQIVSVSLSGLPTGLSYDPATRLITGTVSTTGVWTVTATATDDKGASTSTTFTITIGRDIKPLRLLEPVMNCTTGLFEFRSADGDGTPIEYSIDRVMNWSTQTSFTMPLSARYNEQFDIKARQSGQVYASVYYAGCKASNQFPTVRAPIANQSLIQLQSMSLVIPATTFADADGTIGSVSLTGLPPGLTYAANTLTLSGAPTAAGSWTVTATAMDNQGASVSTTFVITVILQVKALRLLDPLVDCSTGRFEFRSADGDGTPIEYAADDLYSYNVRTVYTLAEQFRTGTRITLRARQSGISYIAYYSTSCINVGNRPPVVSMPIANQSAVVNEPVSFLIPAGTFTDTDGSVALVSVTGLPPGLSYNPATRLITGTVSTTAVWTSTVTATDDKGASTSTTFTITIGRDVKPLRLLEPILNCDTGLFEFRSADGDGSPVEYSIDRVVDWSTQSSFVMAVGPRYNEQLDIKARQSGQVYANVYYPGCPPPNQLPTVKTIIPNQTLTQFRNMSLEILATTFADADGIIVLVSMTGLPPGLTYAANTATLSGAPTAAGSWTATVMATDDRGGKVTTTFVITVLPQAKPLRLLAPIIDCITGRLEFQTADGDGTAIGYSIDQLLDWTSQPVYTLAEGPRYGTVLTLRVRQGGVEQTLAFTTPCQRTNKPPVVANRIADQVLIVNQPASVTLPANTFVDPDGTITSVTLTGLPVGISYDPTKRAIQGTPTLIGTSPAVAKATDNAGASVSDTFLITVRVATRFAVTTTLLDVQGRVLKDLIDADLLDSKKMPLLANLSCQPKVAAGSVLMELTGKVKRTVYANAAPYLLYPSGQGFKPEVGSYQFKVSVFSGANGTGTLLGTSIVRFDIIIANEGG